MVVAYLVAGVLFIRSLGGLSQQETAQRGNLYGIVGMFIAVVATVVQPRIESFGIILGGVIAGGIVGAFLAKRVAMTAMPELVALLHSFVGLAAVLVGVSSYIAPPDDLASMTHAEQTIHLVEIWIGVAVGALTFTGSVIAWAKLRGSISGRPLLLPGRHFANLVIVVASALLIVPLLRDLGAPGDTNLVYMLVMIGLTGLLGVHLVMAIGGADMPVVVSMLNSYSGWAAAATGFMLSNDLLIVTGALVGSSGAILSYIMCEAMNRSFIS
ncbi:MAG: NAD(P)(+) transhydrogenase (Re/Si-specific) subunit beta, partial [Myxococcales bacterium]|nr:NAD(P)(+) transhydrogenase (Re/Si-specific) subunit beta [Myxococcales bacterium]